MLIPVEIDNKELLVRFVFTDDFKKSNITKEKFKDGEFFIDTRGLGVSLQRGNYTITSFCISSAKLISTRVFVGFVFFLKQSYFEACDEMLRERKEFKSELKYTPLDEFGNYHNKTDEIDSDDNGNPSHSDIFFIDPQLMMMPQEQTPNVALRLFSRILCSKSKIYLEADKHDNLNESLMNLFEVNSIDLLTKKQA